MMNCLFILAFFLVGLSARGRPADLILDCGEEWVISIDHSPKKSAFVSGSDSGVVRVWDFKDDKYVSRVLKHFSSPVTALLYCPKGAEVIAGAWDGTLVKLDPMNGKVLRAYPGHRETVTDLAFSPDGKYLASGSADDRMIVWDVETGEELLTMHQGNEYDVTALAFSPDGETIATGDGENQLKLWDASTGEAIKTLKGHLQPVGDVAFNPRGILVSGSWDQTIRIWGRTGEVVLKGHTGEITALRIDGKEGLIFSASEDKTVRVWNTVDGKALETLEGAPASVRCLAIQADGTRVFAGSKGGVLVWNRK